MKREYFAGLDAEVDLQLGGGVPGGRDGGGRAQLHAERRRHGGGDVHAGGLRGLSSGGGRKAKYCVDDDLIEAVEKTGIKQEGLDRLSRTSTAGSQYIWSTGANWGGPIGKFTLTIDKGDPKNFVSFCWDGEVTKTGPTTFEAKATDFFPPWDRELEILILDYREPN